MASLGKVITTLEAQSDAFSKGTDQASKDLEAFRKKVQATKADVGGLRGVLDKLKADAGRGSTLDEFGKTLRGAGAVAGIALIGEALKNATNQAKEINQQFRQGQIDATGMGVKIAESIPILGGFVSAGQNIREMFTHEQEQIDVINNTSKLTNDIMEERVKLTKQVAAEQKEYARSIAESNAKVIESTLKPGERKVFEVDFQFGEKREDLQKKLKEQLDGIDDAIKEERKKVQPELDKMRAALFHSTEGTDAFKTLRTNVDQLQGTMQALTDKGKAQKQSLIDSANAAGVALGNEQRVAEREPLATYLEDLQKHLDELNPDPVSKVRIEVQNLGGNANDARNAIDLLNKTNAAEAYKKNADGLKDWSKELDETAAKIAALQAGADEKVAEQWSKLHTDDLGQRSQFAEMAERQRAEDAALKTIENQKKVTEQILDLQKEAAQVGMTEAQKHLDDIRRDGGSDKQVAQAKALQEQVDAQTKAADQWKKDQEDAKKLIESSLTPLEKFQTEANHIDDLLAEGLLTADQATQALNKQAAELGKATKDDNRHVGAQTRRFDFALPHEPKHQDPNKQALQLAKQNLDLQKQISFYLQQLYNFGQTDQQTSTVTYNF